MFRDKQDNLVQWGAEGANGVTVLEIPGMGTSMESIAFAFCSDYARRKDFGLGHG